MTIDEAIRILEHNDDTFQVYTVTIRNKAVQLGNEALKAVQYVRRNYADILAAKLPGETLK